MEENFAGRYIFGNEDFPHVYDTFFKKYENNLYICVGSIRCFVSAAFGSFSHVILIDKDPMVTDFNRRFGKIISELSSRQQFLEWVDQKELENENIKSELESYFAHDPNFAYFFWKNDDAYSKLQSILHEKRMAMISCNIEFGPGIDSIIKLVSIKEWTNVYFDISNIVPNFVPAKDIFNTLNDINRHAILYLLFKLSKKQSAFTEYGAGTSGPHFYFYADKFDDIKMAFLRLSL
jgi:hypothetical protein